MLFLFHMQQKCACEVRVFRNEVENKVRNFDIHNTRALVNLLFNYHLLDPVTRSFLRDQTQRLDWSAYCCERLEMKCGFELQFRRAQERSP
jgi:hypothetical protein